MTLGRVSVAVQHRVDRREWLGRLQKEAILRNCARDQSHVRHVEAIANSDWARRHECDDDVELHCRCFMVWCPRAARDSKVSVRRRPQRVFRRCTAGGPNDERREANVPRLPEVVDI